MKNDEAKAVLLKEALNKGYKLTGTQDCQNLAEEIEKAIETVDPTHKLKLEGKTPKEIEEHLENEPMIEINADTVGEEEIPVERGNKFAIIFPKASTPTDWILDNYDFI